jgi:hypothetical protein
LECPSEGLYEGKCEYRREGKAFILTCPHGVTELEPGCEGVADDPVREEDERSRFGKAMKECTFEHEEVKPEEYFDLKSFRTLCPECPEARCSNCPPELACASRVIIGCKKGEFIGGKCRIGTETHVIFHGEPKPK